MSTTEIKTKLVSRHFIGETVRELRTQRRWTQRELAARLGLSQARLSEIERGGGSFSAEQLIEILKVFNVGVDRFDPDPRPDESLQNALAAFGAKHLRESRALVRAEHGTPVEAVRAVLLESASARWVTGLAPLLVSRVDSIPLSAMQSDLAQAGRPWRLPWLVENTLAALAGEKPAASLPWRRAYARAEVVLGNFLDHVASHHEREPDGALDLLDKGVRSAKTLRGLVESRSGISRRWGVVSDIQVEDFVVALREAREVGGE